MFYDDFFFGII